MGHNPASTCVTGLMAPEVSLRLTRRSLVRTGVITALSPILGSVGVPFVGSAARAQVPSPAGNVGRDWKHGLSLFGELKYPPGFKHFDYVNPRAPKGGAVRMVAFGTFDNFNEVVSGLKGSIAMGVGMTSDTLTVSSLDEVSTDYGLIAELVSHAPDFAWASFRLRTAARFHDGKPITVDDVIFSMEAFKKHSPMMAAYYRHVVKVEQTGEREVTFIFDAPGNREMPVILGQLNVLPKHWWEGTDAAGKKRDVGATTLEPPLGNGAFRVKEFVAGRTVVYERVKDYWGKDLNVNIGRDNFDEMRFEYFRDQTVALEAFKADHVDWRTENSAKNWATAYDFPAVKDKRVLLEEFPIRDRGIMQAFAFNTRRDKFKDPRVRRAFNFAFDFEEMNKQIFFGQYTRINSYFDGTELASSGLPQGQELEILETVRDKVPPELFTTPYSNPVGGNPENVRANLREGMRLLKEAGYEVRNQKQVNTKTGEPLTVEILHEADPGASASSCSTSRPSIVSASTSMCEASTTSSTRTGCAIGISTSSSPHGRNRCRRATSSATTGVRRRRTRRVAQLHRHQEPCSRCADRTGDLRQGPGRTGRRHQGARPCPAVEPLRRAAIHLSARAARRAGIVLADRIRCRNMPRRRSRRYGGGTRKERPRPGPRA